MKVFGLVHFGVTGDDAAIAQAIAGLEPGLSKWAEAMGVSLDYTTVTHQQAPPEPPKPELPEDPAQLFDL